MREPADRGEATPVPVGPTDPRGTKMSEEQMEKLRQALIGAKKEEGLEATQALLDENVDPVIILQEGMATAMFTLGAMWSRGEVFLPEVVASATLFKMCNELVEPAL